MTTTVPTRPLRHPDFRMLVTGSAASAFGRAIAPVALAFAVIDLGGSATELGLVVAVFALVEVVTALFGGVLGDRLPRRVLMEGSALGSALVQAVLAVTLLTDVATIPLVTVLGGLTGVLSALSQPSSRAMTRLTVPPDALPTAVATRTMLETSAMTVGFAAGGVLVAAIGSGWAIAIDAATYALAALCFRRLRVAQAAPGPRGSMLGDIGDGLREVLRHTWLWLMILQAMVYHLLYGGAQGVLGPIVVGEGIGRSAWGFAMAALMAGFVVGSVVAMRWRPRRSLYAGAALLCLTSLFPLAMALADRLWPILLGAFLHGFGLQLFDIFWDLSIQQHVPEDKLARVYSLDAVGSFVARPVGLAVTGPVAEVVGLHRWLLVVGCAMLAVEVAALFSRDVRRLERASGL